MKAKKRIMLIEDGAIYREPLALTLEGAGYRVLTAENGREALKALQLTPTPFDLLLLDLAMPDMDGISFLRNIRKCSQWEKLPVIVLSAHAERDVVGQVFGLGISTYLVKASFSLQDLLALIEKHVAEQDTCLLEEAVKGSAIEAKDDKHTQDSKENDNASSSGQDPLERIKQRQHLKALGATVQEVIALTASSRSDSKMLAQVLAHDPVLSQRVLQIANSAVYAGRKGYTATLEEAVVKLGYGSVSNIAASAAVFEAFKGSESSSSFLLRFWEHSLGTSIVMQHLVSQVSASVAIRNAAYLVGLCHDLGELLLRQEFQRELSTIDDGLDLHSLANRLETSYQGLIIAAIAALELPPIIAEPIQEHALHSLHGPKNFKNPLAGYLWLANLYVHGLLLGPSANSSIQPITKNDYVTVVGPSHNNHRLLDSTELRSMLQTEFSHFAQSSTTQLSTQSIAERKKILYIRANEFANTDPLFAALEAYGDTIAINALHDDIQLHLFDYLIAVLPTSKLPNYLLDAALASNIDGNTAGKCKLVAFIPASEDVQKTPDSLPIELMTYPSSPRELKRLFGGELLSFGNIKHCRF